MKTIHYNNTLCCIIVALTMLGITSCVKNNSLETKAYYCSVALSQVAVTDAVPLSVYSDDVYTDSLSKKGTLLGINLAANKNVRLKVYEPVSKKLVGDTVIKLAPYAGASYKVIYSPALSAAGFLSASGTGKDSVKIQVILSLNATLYPYSKLDLYVSTYVSNKVANLALVVPGLEMGKMDKRVFTLPRITTTGTSIYYVCQFKDPATGQFIAQRATGNSNVFVFMNTTTAYNGFFNLMLISDNGAADGSNRISTKITTIN